MATKTAAGTRGPFSSLIHLWISFEVLMTPTARLSIWFLLLAPLVHSAAADRGGSVVSRDWYFRESLAA
nr:hypothetical protein [Pirellulaceae bacterium]